jgi:hypothetical protein
VLLRFAAFAALSITFAFAQAEVPSPLSGSMPAITAPALPVDQSDPVVLRAQQRLEQIKKLVSAGALPLMRLNKAQEDVQDAMDMSVLKNNLYSTDILPEQADQMVFVAQRMVVRREKALLQMKEMVAAGLMSRSEADVSGTDLDRAERELDLAQSRATLVSQLAENARIQKGIASLESQVESHPDWAGKVYSRYDGSGIFTPSEKQTMETDYLTRFAKPLPISAEGETALHRSFGFDHRGRVDVALNPDQPEGVWLMRYLEAKKIPYFAFRAAVPHKATGAHIHVGPQSTRLALAD